MKKDIQLFFFACFAILASYGFLASVHTPIHDDIGTLVWPYRDYGLSYFANKDWDFFRPIEYYIFALGEKLSFSGFPIIVNFFILSITSVYATKITLQKTESFTYGRPVEFLVCAFFVLTPIIAASSFNADLLSQCLANFCIIYLLWDITSQKGRPGVALAVLALGFLSKESFYPFAALYPLIKILSSPSSLAAYSYLAVPIFGLLLRGNVIASRSLEGIDRYQINFGLNIFRNIFLHLAGLFYAGSSPDIFARNLARESFAIFVTLMIVGATLVALTKARWKKQYFFMILFLVFSLLPGVFLNGVSEHNASAFVWIGSILVLSICFDAYHVKYVAVGLLLFGLASAVSDFRKASLLATTMADHRTMLSEYKTTGKLRCRRNFERPYSFYFFNSNDHIYFVTNGRPDSKYLTCLKPGL
ncbi:MAG: hypothetical protein ACK59G_01915 [Cyanobacteriota bacterium]